MPKVLVLEGVREFAPEKWDEMAKEYGVDLVECTANSRKELLEYFSNNDVVVIANKHSTCLRFGGYDAELVQQLPSHVKAICNFGAGVDILGDLKAWSDRGIQVSNTPSGVRQAAADTALYLILSTLRNYYRLESNLRAGKFLDGIPVNDCDEADGKTLGILGLGGIGSDVLRKVRGSLEFGKFQYSNRGRAAPEIEDGAEFVDFDTLLRTSDVLLLALPLTSHTHHIINAEAIRKMKNSAIIVNIARGPLIDEDALVAALDEGRIRSVGLDVFENEPKIHPGLVNNPNTVLLPHAGTHTAVARKKMELETLANVRQVLKTGIVLNAV